MIKQRLALTLLSFLLAIPAGGLEGQAAKLFGVTGGATYTGFSSYSRGSKMGGIVGLTVGVRQWNWTVVNLEASWAQRGADGVELEQIDVPLLFGGSRDLGDGLRLRGYTGIQVGYNISCNSSVTGAECSRINKWQWAWPIGLQIGKYRSGGTFVAADVRYAWFLNDAFENRISNQRGWEFKLILGKAR
jgi:hypothetical protein